MHQFIRWGVQICIASAIAFFGLCTPSMAAGPLAGINSANHFLIYYGNDFSPASQNNLSRYDVLVIDPNAPNVTPAVVANLQANGVTVLAYISLGEDQAFAEWIGDGTGPVYHDGVNIVPENNGIASFYVDQEWNGSQYVSDGAADINTNFTSRFVLPNASWRQVVKTQRRGDGVRNLVGLEQIAAPRISDTDTNGANNFGFDGFFLETLDTAAPYANTWGYYAWAAPAMQQTVKFIRGTYPNAIMMANRGLFFFNPALINATYNIRPFDYTIRPYINAVLFESYTLDYSNTVSPFHNDNKYNHAPKIMAEANRPDGFTVFSLDYAMGKSTAELNLSYNESVVENGWLEHIAGTGGLADFYNYAENTPYPADTRAPIWDSTAGQSPLPVASRVGVQTLAPGMNSGEIIVGWDVARDQSLPIKYNIYISQDGGITYPDVRRAVYFRMGQGWSSDPVNHVANEYTVTGLVPGNEYCFIVRAEDSSLNNFEDSNHNSMCLVASTPPTPLKEISNPLSSPMLVDGTLSDWAGLIKFGPRDPANDTYGSVDIVEVMMAHDASNFYLSYLNNGSNSLSWMHNLYIDADTSHATGFIGGSGTFPIGADYLIQGASLYQYQGTGSDWNWSFVAPLSSAINGNTAELSFARTLIGDPLHMRLFFYGDNVAPNAIDVAPDGALVSGLFYAYYTAPVTLPDTTPPLLTVPADILTEATAAFSVINIGSATAVDAVDGILTASNNAPVAFPLGTTTVTWSATDNSGNTATATQSITVMDTTPPTVQAPASITLEASGLTGNSVNIGMATAIDIVNGKVPVINDAPATFPLGTTLVTWSSTDASGNTGNATQNITVVDTTAPILSVPLNVTVEATASNTIVATGMATAFDSVDGALLVSNNAPLAFPLGTTIVTWSATDNSGNTATATQSITVVDTTPPMLTVPADIKIRSASKTTPVNIGNATATDIFAVSITNDAPALFPRGKTIVTWTATDASGNVTQATQTVKVKKSKKKKNKKNDD